MSEALFEREGLENTTHNGDAIIDSSRFAFLLFLGVDVMLFVGLIGGYFVLRGGAFTWPPPSTPTLDSSLQGFGTLAFVIGTIALGAANGYHEHNKVRPVRRMLFCAAIMFMFFLMTNVMEWNRLSADGLRMSSLFGSVFYITIGAFLLHVVVGLAVLTRTLTRTAKWSTYTRSSHAIPHMSYYFYMLTAIWVTLYTMMYL